jgi:hypothetical protein
MRGMTRGELEARVLDAQRTQVTAPPEVSAQLRLTAQAEADAWQQVTAQRGHAQAAGAEALTSQIAAKRQQLEAVNDRYERWSAATTGTRETAAKARAELNRRGLARQQQSEPKIRQSPLRRRASSAVLGSHRHTCWAVPFDRMQRRAGSLHPEGQTYLRDGGELDCQARFDGQGAIELASSSGYPGRFLAAQGRSTLPPTAHQ